MKILKQSTAVTIKMGPFVDSTDGNTEETGLTIAQADVKLSKAHGALAAKNDAGSATHDANGIYGVPLNATDTGTLGQLKIYAHPTGALPVWDDYLVVPANVYEALAGGEYLEVTSLAADVSISGNTITVRKRDGSTTQYTKTATSAAGANPITGLD
jgi:hypothetical protein